MPYEMFYWCWAMAAPPTHASHLCSNRKRKHLIQCSIVFHLFKPIFWSLLFLLNTQVCHIFIFDLRYFQLKGSLECNPIVSRTGSVMYWLVYTFVPPNRVASASSWFTASQVKSPNCHAFIYRYAVARNSFTPAPECHTQQQGGGGAFTGLKIIKNTGQHKDREAGHKGLYT